MTAVDNHLRAEVRVLTRRVEKIEQHLGLPIAAAMPPGARIRPSFLEDDTPIPKLLWGYVCEIWSELRRRRR